MPEAETLSPAVLVWARETAGLTVEEAAARLGLADTLRASAADKLRSVEGSGQVGRPTLLRMVATYKRPLLNFYLQRPPPKDDQGVDFRTRSADRSKREDAILEALIRDVRVRQAVLRDVLEDEESEPNPFVGAGRQSQGLHVGASAVRGLLHLDTTPFPRARDVEQRFRELRRRVELAGIVVLLAGDLGNYRSAIGSGVFSGLAAPDPIAPLVVINPNQARTAQCFTLIHECVHIWLGAGGVSAGPETRDEPARSISGIEAFCDAVAAEVLLPEAFMPDASEVRDGSAEAVTAFVDRVARAQHVSPAMVLFRLGRKGSVDAQTWRDVAAILRGRWNPGAATGARDEDTGSGPDFYTVRRSRVGKLALDIVARALGRGNLTYSRAGQALGVRPGMVEGMLGRGSD